MIKQKFYLVVLACVLVLMSCKKTYTCECTLIRNHTSHGSPDSTYTENYNGGSSAYGQKMTEKQAKAACKHEEQSILSNYESANNSVYSQFSKFGIKPDPNDQFSASCTLK